MRRSMKIVPGMLGVLGLCALLTVVPPVADAAKPEANDAGGQVAAVKLDPVGSWAGGNAADLSVGWEFETTDSVRVTELGVWNHGGGPLDADVPVAIWGDAGNVVVATRVPAGDESHAVDGFRYTPIEPVELAAGKRYVIGALHRRGTKAGEVIGNGASMTTAGPIRWVKPRRAQTRGLALPEARAEDGIGVGSFGPNFLMAPSDATRQRGTYYRSRHLGWPVKHSVAVIPEKPDGSHREENVLAVTLFADRMGKLTQVLMNDTPLDVGRAALEGVEAEMKRNAELAPGLRPEIRVAAMDSVTKEDRAAVAALIDRDYLDPGLAREPSDGIVPLAKSRVKQPSRDGRFPDADRFRDHGEYVEDRWTGLLWQKDGLAAGKRNFYEAKEYGEQLELGGMKGWRVPGVEELRTIFPATFAPFDDKKYTPKQCCAGAEEFASYWTSELDLRSDDYAYVFHWYNHGGANNCIASRNFAYVRCVHDPIPGWK